MSGISEIKKAPEGACFNMLKRFRIVRYRRLIQCWIHVTQIIWRDLVDVIVEPVGKQQITVAAPGRARFVLRIVFREIVVRDIRIQTRFNVTKIL